jgi:hypothetical protein
MLEPADRERAISFSEIQSYVTFTSLRFSLNQVKMAIATQTPNTVKYRGEQAPVCALETIDFSRLLSQEPEELEKLLRCCQTQGFFYLDLQGLDGRRILHDEQQLLHVMREFFSQTAETKMEIGLPSQSHGLVVRHHD